jgi:hypothetical protein
LVPLALISSAAGVYMYHSHELRKIPPAAVEKKPEKVLPVPVRSEAVPVPEPTVVSGYVIGVISVSKSVNGQIISLKVTNDGSTPLSLNPDIQFKLVGLKDGTARTPIPEKTTADFSGVVAPGASLKGSVTFDVIAEQASELRFYPEPTAQNYIVVPLIPLPEDQR